MNHGSSQAKIVDLDQGTFKFFSNLFGMTLALLNNGSTTPAVVGSSPPFQLQEDAWASVPCPLALSLAVEGAHSSTILQNVTWSTDGSEILQQMRRQAGGRELSIGFTLYNHCPADIPNNELIGCKTLAILWESLVLFSQSQTLLHSPILWAAAL